MNENKYLHVLDLKEILLNITFFKLPLTRSCSVKLRKVVAIHGRNAATYSQLPANAEALFSYINLNKASRTS